MRNILDYIVSLDEAKGTSEFYEWLAGNLLRTQGRSNS